MARAFRGGFRGSRGPRRSVAWTVGPEGIVAAAGAGSKTAFTNGAVLVTEKATITRIIGRVFYHLDSLTAARQDVEIGIGIVVVSEDAFNVGATAFPGPLTDPESHWLWRVGFHPFSTATDPAMTDIGAAMWFDFDVKGQQKIRVGDAEVGVMEVVSASAVVSEATMGSRVLIKLT